MSDPSDRRSGVVFMLLGVALFKGNDALAKHMVGLYAPPQLLFVRAVAGMVLIAPAILRQGVRRTFDVRRKGLHTARALLLVAEIAIFFFVVGQMPLADVSAVYQSTPIFVTALAALSLGERVDAARWVAVAAGLAGVLLVIRPFGEGWSAWALLALAGSLLYAVVQILTRSLRADGDVTLVAWQTAAMFPVLLPVLPFVWRPMGWTDLAFAVAIGLVSTVGHVCVNRALRLAPASLLAPFQYTGLVWSVLLGWWFWGELPDLFTVVGAAVVIASGLFLYRRDVAQGQAAG